MKSSLLFSLAGAARSTVLWQKAVLVTFAQSCLDVFLSRQAVPPGRCRKPDNSWFHGISKRKRAFRCLAVVGCRCRRQWNLLLSATPKCHMLRTRTGCTAVVSRPVCIRPLLVRKFAVRVDARCAAAALETASPCCLHFVPRCELVGAMPTKATASV